jgi:pyruvate kinase
VRTGPIGDGPTVLKLKPVRDSLGHVLRPSSLWLGATGAAPVSSACDAAVVVDADWLKHLRVGSLIDSKWSLARAMAQWPSAAKPTI